MLSVIVSYRALPGEADALERLLATYAELVRAEPGCRVFEASRSDGETDVFNLYEVYESRDALAAHVASEHYAAYVTEEFLPRLADRTVSFGAPVSAVAR